METKNRLMKQLERERIYCESLEVGSEEYVASLYRLLDLEKQLAELEKFEAETDRKNQELANERINQLWGRLLEVGKIVIVDVGIPVAGLVAITAVEKDITFTGALRDYTKLFLPKKRR